MKNIIIVTGGAGFVGSNFVKYFTNNYNCINNCCKSYTLIKIFLSKIFWSGITNDFVTNL